MSDDRIHCAHCGEEVPPGAYCGNCGAHLATDRPEHRRRGWAYAAAPHEHVLQFSVVSTLFPHLPHRHAHAFRRALVAGVAVVAVLATLHLYAAATLAASLVLPILYLLYLYDVRVYEHEPVVVVLSTFVAGAVLGGAATWLLNKLVSGAAFSSLTGSPSAGSVLLGGLLTPVVAQILMVLGPLALLNRRHFNESLDGLAFGVTSALGYSLAMMLFVFGPVITATPLQADALDWAVRIVREGFFVFTVNAGATAAITSSIWLQRHGRNRGRHSHWLRTLPIVIVVAFGLQIVLGIASTTVPDVLQLFVIWAAAAVAALVYLRLVIHHALLEEGDEFTVGPDAVCMECHHVVPTMLFCPNCGVARSAAPKHAATAPEPAPEAAS